MSNDALQGDGVTGKSTDEKTCEFIRNSGSEGGGDATRANDAGS